MAQRITLDLLTEKGACSDQMELFTELFPNGTEVTEELCEEHAEQFDFYWAAKHLLPIQAWQEYVHTRYEALAEYRRIRNETWTEYRRIRNEAAWTEYERIDDGALAEYEHIDDEAWTECKRTCATEFARLWLEYMPD